MEKRAIRADTKGARKDPVYLVMERDPLVLDDIVGSLKALAPCRVIRVDDVAAVPDMLRNETCISAALLDLPYAKVVEHGLADSLTGRGARIILTVGEDDQAETLARGWGMLVRPFTDRMIHQVVRPTPLT